MFGNNGGGYGGNSGAWNSWGGEGVNPNLQQNANQQGNQPIRLGQGQMASGQQYQLQQFQQKQTNQFGNLGYAAAGGTGGNSMMGGYGGGVAGSVGLNNPGMGLGSNPNAAALMALSGTNAGLYNMSGTGMNNSSGNMLNMNLGNSPFGQQQSNQFNQQANNQFNQQSNPYGQQLPFLQQQQQQHLQQQQLQLQQNIQQQQQLQIQQQSQSVYQTPTGFPRPAPPLPPGPPPKNLPSRDLSQQPLFNNVITAASAPPLPNQANPVPPPLPADKSNNKPPLPPLPVTGGQGQRFQDSHNLLDSTDSGSRMSSLMSLNVSQDIFGGSKISGSGNQTGIPGLGDLSDIAAMKGNVGPSYNNSSLNRPNFQQSGLNSSKNGSSSTLSKAADDNKSEIEIVDYKPNSGDRKLNQKPSPEWNKLRNEKIAEIRQSHQQTKVEEQVESKNEIKWELRSEFDKVSVEVDTPKPEPKATESMGSQEMAWKGNEKIVPDVTINFNKTSQPFPSDSSTSKPIVEKTLNTKDTTQTQSSGPAASIPLGTGDGTPIEYDRKTLRAFDRKFREWEKQFENWKESNENHPDRDAYNKYMEQWNLWRQQLIEQRRFILDSMNKARLEGTEIALQKGMAITEFDMAQEKSKAMENTPEVDNEGNSSVPNSERNPRVSSGNNSAPNNSNFSRKPQNSDNFNFNRKVQDQNLHSDNSNFNRKGQDHNPRADNSNFNRNLSDRNSANSDKSNVNRQTRVDELRSNNSASGNFGNAIQPEKIRNEFHQQQNINRVDRNFGGLSDQFKPPSLMALPLQADLHGTPKKPENSFPAKPTDRPIERILRDKDRQDLLPPNPDYGGGNAAGGRRSPENRRNVDRVSRDPQSRAQEKNLFSGNREVDPWSVASNTNENPFEVAEKKQTQNLFCQSQVQNPFSSWGSADDNLPKLADFLQKDSFSNLNSSGNKNQNIYSNFGSSTLSATSNSQNFNDMRNTGGSANSSVSINQKGPLSRGLVFEPTVQGMPLVTAKTIPEPEEKFEESSTKEEETSFDISQWFTRDRRRGGYDEFERSARDEPEPEQDDGEGPAVIDYGHGTSKPGEEDEFDIPRGERPDVRRNRRDVDSYSKYDDEDEREKPVKDVVTIDYGHGSVAPHVEKGYDENDEEYYEEEEEEYNEEEDYYPEYPFPHPPFGPGMRGRGLRGRFPGMMHPLRFMGPGFMPPLDEFGFPIFPPGPRFGPRGPFGMMGPHPMMRGMRPFPNRGGGRGFPIRFPGHMHPLGYEDERPVSKKMKEGEGSQREESPEIVVLAEKNPRRAPPRGDSSQGRPDRRIRDSSRDRSRRGRSRDRSKDRSHDRSRDLSKDKSRDRSRSLEKVKERMRAREERHKLASDSSKDRDDRGRSTKLPRDEDRRVRRDDSPFSRRDRDRDTKDRTRIRRSRSRSPTFDRISVYRNQPGGTAAGSNDTGGVNPPPPRYQTVMIEDILNQPGRLKRPSQIVVILRGLPGSGKTHVAKLIKDRETEMGGSAPRILSIDDYFMAETEKLVRDPLTGAEVKETVMEYEFESDLEPKYRYDLIRTFKKNVDNGYFQFIIVDSVNDQVRHFEDMVAFAIQKRFQVYIAEVEESLDTCVKRNVHKRTKDQIQKIQKHWERTPPSYVKLDIRPLLQDEAVQDVEMEDVSDMENTNEDDVVAIPKKPVVVDSTKEATWEEDETANEDSGFFVTSKWDKLEPSEEKLNKLDGLAKKPRGGDDDKVDSLTVSVDSWLQSHLPEDYTSRQQTKPGQKRVRWADIEERRAQERMRDVGFVVGHTDWNRMTDPTFGSSALTRTKFI